MKDNCSHFVTNRAPEKPKFQAEWRHFAHRQPEPKVPPCKASLLVKRKIVSNILGFAFCLIDGFLTP
jgi:hypothetical protein